MLVTVLSGVRPMLKKFRAQLLKKEKEMTARDGSFHPVKPVSVDLFKWVKERHPDAYQEMLHGTEIGFQKFTGLFKQYNQQQ